MNSAGAHQFTARYTGSAGTATSAPLTVNVVQAGTGLLVGAGDHDALADAILSVLSDADRRADLGRRGREEAFTRYGSDRLVADIDRLYVDLFSAAHA